jgi:hypothetical protein
MKFVTLLLLSGVLSGTAVAGFIPDVELSLVTSNGPVPPQHRVRTECKISGGMVTKITTKASGESKPITKKVNWTGLVSDAREMTALLEDASEGTIRTHSAPLGGRFFTYDGAYRSKTSSKMKEVHLKNTRDLNLSNEAKTLIEFIDSNCK